MNFHILTSIHFLDDLALAIVERLTIFPFYQPSLVNVRSPNEFPEQSRLRINYSSNNENDEGGGKPRRRFLSHFRLCTALRLGINT